MVRLRSGGAGLLLLGLGAAALAAGGGRLLLVAAVLPAGHPRDQHLHAKEHMSAHSTYRTAPGIPEMSICLPKSKESAAAVLPARASQGSICTQHRHVSKQSAAAVLPAGHPRDQHLHAKEYMSAHSTYRTAPGIPEMSICPPQSKESAAAVLPARASEGSICTQHQHVSQQSAAAVPPAPASQRSASARQRAPK